MSHPFLGLALFAASAACSAPPAEPRTLVQDEASVRETPAAAPRKLTLEDVFELNTKLKPKWGGLQGWLDGSHYLSAQPLGDSKQPALVAVDAATGEARPLYSPERMAAAFAALPGIQKEEAEEWAARSRHELSARRDGILLHERGDLFYWRLDAEKAARLTNDPAEEVGEAISPDGSLVAFIKDYDLHVVPVAGGEVRALTTAGDEDHLHGRLDWVYQEEVYGRGNFQGYWWSPDSSRIAFLVLDQTPVPTYTVVDHREVHPEVEVWRYPKAGDPNPVAKLAVVDVAGGEPRFLDLARYERGEFLIVRVGWTPDSAEVFFQVQDRVQTWLDLVSGDPQNGETEVLFRDSTPAWIEPTASPLWIEGGKRFLWLSERSGYKHLYLYRRDGALERALTSGPWEVDEVHACDEAAGRVYFDADKADVKGSQLWRVKLDGSGLAAVTSEPGAHAVAMSPDASHFVDTYSSLNDPGRVELCTSDGAVLRTLARGDSKTAQERGLCDAEFAQVPTRDGFEMEAYLIKPPGFDPSVRYPVLCHVYSGPHAPQVRDAWAGFNRLFHHMLAQEGTLIWVCDNRSASGKGLQSAAGIRRSAGAQELADIEQGLDWLVAQGYADPGRIGIWGWSYGGYMTAYALTHSKRFKLGIAGAPVTDWRLYDSIYTERYMDLPQANAAGYEASSTLEAAADLHGELLLVHGVIDENVHMQNTLQLAHKLQEAGKPFRLMLYPGSRHGVVDPAQRRHLYSMMADFVREKL